jgi:hypothetical protein
MIKRILFVVVVLLGHCFVAASWQQSSADLVSKIRGKNQKVWVFTRFENHMGGNKCERGESWTFLQNGRLRIKRCEANVIKTEEKHWKLETRSQIDDVLIIDDKEYILLFPPGPARGKEQMILRLKAETKAMPTKDLVFYHEVD